MEQVWRLRGRFNVVKYNQIASQFVMPKHVYFDRDNI